MPPEGADEGAGSRLLSCRGAHCAPAVFNPNSAAGAGPRPARRPFCRARPPGRAARVYHVSAVGAAHRATRQQAHSARIPNICIQTSHKGPNSSLFERGQSLPCKREGDRRRRWRDSISSTSFEDGIPQSPPEGGDSPLSQGGRCTNSNKEEFTLWRPIKQPIIS